MIPINDCIRVYDRLPVEEQKQWMTARQLAIAFPFVIYQPWHIKFLINSKDVRTEFMLHYTEDFINEMVDSYGYKDSFNDETSYYSVKIYFFKEDVKPFVRKGGRLYEKARYIPKKVLREKKNPIFQTRHGLLEFIHDKNLEINITKEQSVKRNINRIMSPFPKYRINFTGFEDDIEIEDGFSADMTYRLFYGFIFLRDYIHKAFLYLYGLSEKQLDNIMFVYMMRFFRYSDLIENKKETFKWLYDNKYIEKMQATFDTNYRYVDKFKKNPMYVTTMKANKVVQVYMDYMLLRKKLPVTGIPVVNELGIGAYTTIDISQWFKSTTSKTGAGSGVFMYSRRKTMVRMYSAIYDYVNLVKLTKLIDTDTLEKLHRNRVPFKFSPMIWEMYRSKIFAGDDNMSSERDKRHMMYVDSYLRGSVTMNKSDW